MTILTTFRIVTLNGAGLPSHVDAEGYDCREAAEAIAEDCDWIVREVQEDVTKDGSGFAR